MLDDSSSGSQFKPLLGTDEATIDDKGRILVGKKKRERLGDNFAMAFSESGCLAAYPERTFRKICNDLESSPNINLGRLQYARLVMGTADDELSFDGQGRVVVPQKLRELGKLVDKVVLVGAYDRLEIWAKAEWDKYVEDPDGYGRQRIEAINKALQTMKS
ncbi:MAG: division/cell wall cluster transcriptional repressor MraZ [Fimbriimonas sp.]